jgi:hypothetical protein
MKITLFESFGRSWAPRSNLHRCDHASAALPRHPPTSVLVVVVRYPDEQRGGDGRANEAWMIYADVGTLFSVHGARRHSPFSDES